MNLLNAYASRLPPSLIESLSGVLRSRLISLPKTLIVIHRVGKEKGFKSPPMICIGHSDEHQMDKAFAQVFKLVNQIGQAEKKFNLQARMDDKLLLSSLRTGILGASRLSESEVKSYLESQKR